MPQDAPVISAQGLPLGGDARDEERDDLDNLVTMETPCEQMLGQWLGQFLATSRLRNPFAFAFAFAFSRPFCQMACVSGVL